MLTFHPAYALMCPPSKNESLNEDHAHYLSTQPVPAREPLRWRLLPGVIRTPLKAYLEARAYERSLVHIWEISPHLLDDIGVVLGVGDDLNDDMVTAPSRVVDQVAAIERARVTAPAPVAAPAVTPAAKPAAEKPVFRPTIPAVPFAKRSIWSAEGAV